MRWRPRLRLTRLGNRPRTLAVATLVLFGAGALYGVCRGVVPAMADHPYFALRSVWVSSDVDYAGAAELAREAGLYQGTSIWAVNTRAAEAALSRPGWVKRARVVRRLPGSVRVAIESHRPLALTLLGTDPHVLAEDGILYAVPAAAVVPDLPWVTGWQQAASRGARIDLLRRAVALVVEAEKVGVRLSQVDCGHDGTMSAYLDSRKLEIIFGRVFEPAESLARLKLLFEHLSSKQLAAVRYIDLSFAGRAVVRASGDKAAAVLSARGRRWEAGRG